MLMFTMYKFYVDMTNNEKRLKKRMEIENGYSSGLDDADTITCSNCCFQLTVLTNQSTVQSTNQNRP